MPAVPACPTGDQLLAHARGPGSGTESIASHLAACAGCRRRVAAMTGDEAAARPPLAQLETVLPGKAAPAAPAAPAPAAPEAWWETLTMPAVTACPTGEQLRGHARGPGSGPGAESIAAHLAACEGCRRRVAVMAGNETPARPSVAQLETVLPDKVTQPAGGPRPAPPRHPRPTSRSNC
ncbi:hypothetical protein [Fimbriiglobus ruber]|uniref:Zinc-finger domain-containing protein n=1 Tax=Fimbriiglobus ruber TaxID=1908690 RepID=A0A225DA37_9BACT|nr:hypothetical protein [Fimbriiglobus ruber]OWK37823.1 hypothetical protein FRUB_06943 [Fimbriiglobus ruber]